MYVSQKNPPQEGDFVPRLDIGMNDGGRLVGVVNKFGGPTMRDHDFSQD